MMSKVIFFFLSCLCISVTAAVSDSILQLVCRNQCDRCRRSQSSSLCSLCNCNTNQRPTGPCANTRCPFGETCRVSRRGWFRTQVAVCVPQGTTTTTTERTTVADDGCRRNADCQFNEACVIPSGELVGTCKIVEGRTINERCVEERKLETCRARLPRFFYNVTAGECQGFNYGGCNPGRNHFETIDDCQQECGTGRASASAVTRNSDCLLEKDTGICRALMPSFYFDRETSACQEFFYGGCGGNANRFSTKDECVSKCGGST